MRMTQGWTAAHCAAEAGSLEILKMLSQYSGVLISRDDAGITPRQIAQTYGHDGCVEFLEMYVCIVYSLKFFYESSLRLR